VTFPIASVPELTAAEADADTGDIRKVLFALLDQIADVWYDQETADRPVNMTIFRSSSTDPETGEVTRNYQIQFNLAVGAIEVVDEPAE